MKLKLDSIPENEATEQQKEESVEDSLKVLTICIGDHSQISLKKHSQMLLSNYDPICAPLA